MPATFVVVDHNGIEQLSLDPGNNTHAYTVPAGIQADDILVVKLAERTPGSLTAPVPSGLTAAPTGGVTWAYRRLDGSEVGTTYSMQTGETWAGTGQKGVDWFDAWIIRPTGVTYTSLAFSQFTGTVASSGTDPADNVVVDDDNAAGSWPRTSANRFSCAFTDGHYGHVDNDPNTPLGSHSASSASPSLAAFDTDHLEQATHSGGGSIVYLRSQTAFGTGVALDNAPNGIDWTWSTPGDVEPFGTWFMHAGRLEVRLGGVTDLPVEHAYWGTLGNVA